MFKFIIGIMIALAIVSIVVLRFMNRPWWKSRLIRYSMFALPVFGVIGILVMSYGYSNGSRLWIGVGATTASFCMVMLLGTTLSLPLSSILNLIQNRMGRHVRESADEDAAVSGRRYILRKAAAAIPIATLGAGTAGFAGSFNDVRIYRKELEYDELPDSLDGVSILHLSDMHLGRYFSLADFEELAERADELKPDIILLTGDICDVVPDLRETIRLVEELKPRFGAFASLGNHEYYHGVEHSRRFHDRSEVPLLVNDGLMIRIGGTPVFIGGADDPRILRSDVDPFLNATVERTCAIAPSNSFKILMSHRPRGFVKAAEIGIDLTLSGHTHGGQIGVGGRSLFESVDPPNYFWGHYQNGKSQLYTSSGVGHWFPFRLGCPAEAPLLVLKKM